MTGPEAGQFMVSVQSAQSDPGGTNRVGLAEPALTAIDPLARLLARCGVIGMRLPQRLILPGLYFVIYFVLNDIVLPLMLGRFSSVPGYTGPFDPRLQPNRVADGFVMPVLIYYYGRVSILLPGVFDRLRKNGVFGPDSEVSSGNLKFHRLLHDRWAGGPWLFPLAITAVGVVGVRTSFDYFSPPHAHSFINSSPQVFAFNQAMWIFNYFLIAMMIMRYMLLTAWLLRLQRQDAMDMLNPDVLHADGRMGFSPITECVVTAAKIFSFALLLLVLVIRGNENIGLSASSPNWIGYLGILVASLPFVILPIYLVHRIMAHKKDWFIANLADETAYPHSSWLLKNTTLTEPRDRDRWQVAQLLLVRLSQVKDWPVTVEEAATVVFTYLLGTAFTLLSTVQRIVQFLR